MKDEKTVFFGPFVGELGIEIIYWHGWIKRLCRSKYADYHKIACSFPSRYPLYLDVDEFWPLPEKFLENPISSRGYITDNWVRGFPKPDKIPFELPEISPLINEVMNDFKQKLPRHTEFILPWQLNYDDQDQRFYGTRIPENPESEKIVACTVPFSRQILEELQPTSKGIELLKTLVDPKDRLIAIFPRGRRFRRPDKNWVKEKYELLIERLQRDLPQFKIAIFGEPGGAFFADDGVPNGCADLIRIDPQHRLDAQLAALKKSVLAVGSLSGGIALALAAGCRSLTWGPAIGEKGFREQNYTRTGLVFYPSTNPSIDLILGYAKWMLGYGGISFKHEIKRVTLNNIFRVIPGPIRTSKKFPRIKKFLEVGF